MMSHGLLSSKRLLALVGGEGGVGEVAGVIFGALAGAVRTLGCGAYGAVPCCRQDDVGWGGGYQLALMPQSTDPPQ